MLIRIANAVKEQNCTEKKGQAFATSNGSPTTREKTLQEILKRENIWTLMFFEGALYFGWPNQPSSGKMGFLHWYVFICNINLYTFKKSSYVVSVSAFYIFFIYMWSRLDHYWSNVYQQDHRSGCVLKNYSLVVLLQFGCICVPISTLTHSRIFEILPARTFPPSTTPPPHAVLSARTPVILKTNKFNVNQSINQLYLNTVNGSASWFSDMPCDNYSL